MYPDLLGIFGVTLYGVMFERVLWIIGILLMIWGIVSSIQIYRKGKHGEGMIQGLVVCAILLWLSYRLYHTFQPGYVLMFSNPLVLHSYAFMILVGICLGIFTVTRMAPYRNVPPSDMAKLCLWMVVFGFLGARAAHIIVEAPFYWDACFDPSAVGLPESDCLRPLNFAEGGLTFYGGVIAGFFVLIHFKYKHRNAPISLLTIGDLLTAPLAIAHACGRIGCLAAGCCWGAMTSGNLGIHYHTGSFAFDELLKDPALAGELMKTGQTPLMHATQLYEAFGEFALYGILWLLLVKKARTGIMFGTWFISYGVLRFIVEIMRDDTERGSFFDTAVPAINTFFNVAPDHNTFLSTSQGIACAMIVIGIASLIASKKRPSPITASQSPQATDKPGVSES